MLKKILFLFTIMPSLLFAQAEYVSVDNPVYEFLNRMETLKLIEHYNPFEIPKSRKEIGNFLKQVMNKGYALDAIDIGILWDYKIEFQFEVFDKPHTEGDPSVINYNYLSLLNGDGYDLFSEAEKYLFIHLNPGKANIFINLLADGEFISQNNSISGINSSSSLGYYGGEIRGTILNKFGFLLRGYQGQVFGNRQSAMLKKEVAYNYKYNLEPDAGYFDETSGYISADFDLLKLKFGRDRLMIGHGIIKPLVADNSPMFDYLSFNINYKFMNYSYFHGKLLGNSTFVTDSITGGGNVIEEKYIGYHRLSFDFSQDVSFGAGEIIIYGDRGIDLSYLNPFAFYKSIEHSNQDRDNSMLFFDLNTKPVKGLKVFGTLLIDDISFGKIGTGWYGNQTLIHTGIYSANLYKIAPVDLSFEYLRVEPYTLTHRFLRNSYTNFNYNLGSDIQPNSELFFTQINYRFNNRLSVAASYGFTIHGANTLNADSSVKVNVGGNINLGHRVSDSESVKFLDGDREYIRKFTASFLYEPFNQMFLIFKLVHLNNSLQNSVQQKETQMFLTLSVRI